jgi:hypothetical protein
MLSFLAIAGPPDTLPYFLAWVIYISVSPNGSMKLTELFPAYAYKFTTPMCPIGSCEMNLPMLGSETVVVEAAAGMEFAAGVGKAAGNGGAGLLENLAIGVVSVGLHGNAARVKYLGDAALMVLVIIVINAIVPHD